IDSLHSDCTMSAVESIPALPEDLERIIFLELATQSPRYIPALILVARRVKQWVEPVLYRMITLELPTLPDVSTLDLPSFFRVHATKGPDFLARAVRHLALKDVNVAFMDFIFESCPNTEDLLLNYTLPKHTLYASVPSLVRLPLRRLYTYVLDFFDGTELVPKFRPLFNNLTHLVVFGNLTGHGELAEAQERWRLAASLPQLTHLAAVEYNPVMWRVILGNERLVVLAFLWRFDFPPMPQDEHEIPVDLRFVALAEFSSVLDWQKGALGRGDFWDAAEEHVRKRRSGKVYPRAWFLRTGQVPLLPTLNVALG
ncbi:unnamed protein product, partial [Mycena citricolor]